MEALIIYVMIFFVVTSSLLALLVIRSSLKHNDECPFCGSHSPNGITHCDKCIGV